MFLLNIQNISENMKCEGLKMRNDITLIQFLLVDLTVLYTQ
jgi:hypothetical protein